MNPCCHSGGDAIQSCLNMLLCVVSLFSVSNCSFKCTVVHLLTLSDSLTYFFQVCRIARSHVTRTTATRMFNSQEQNSKPDFASQHGLLVAWVSFFERCIGRLVWITSLSIDRRGQSVDDHPNTQLIADYEFYHTAVQTNSHLLS